MSTGSVYLIPTVLSENATDALPSYILTAAQRCSVLFVENERTARRFLRQLDREYDIDGREWHTIHKAEAEISSVFIQRLREGKTVGIISEAGCPGIADPGQLLIAEAQKLGVRIHPLVGPSSILLALMASGLNGQQFRFRGYLPIDDRERAKMIRQMEQESLREQCAQLFIETPYRNKTMLAALLQHCQDNTLLCIASDLTGEKESVRTKTIASWKKEKPQLDKIPTLFLLGH